MQRFFENIPPLTIALIFLLGLVLAVVIIVVSTMGRAGLMRGAWLADSGEANLTFSRLWQEAQTYFLRVFLLGLLAFAITLALVLVIFIPGVLLSVLTLGIALICLLPLICLLVPVLIALSVVFDLTIVAITGENLGVIDALRRAWDVFRAHLGEIIGIGLIVTIGSAVVSFIAGLPLFLIMLPIISNIMNNNTFAFNGFGQAALVLFILYLPILLAVRALITSYKDTTWSVTFRRLTGRSAGSDTESPMIIDAPSSPAL